jgi:hypothetical protein
VFSDDFTHPLSENLDDDKYGFESLLEEKLDGIKLSNLSSFGKHAKAKELFKKDDNDECESGSDMDPKSPKEKIRKLSSSMNMKFPSINVEYSPKRGSRSPRKIKVVKRRKRRDVIIKKILRNCRRFFQNLVSEHTEFTSTKKLRQNDNFYVSMEKFNIEVLLKQGTFDENFYLACLLYPQDLSKNIDSFITKLSPTDIDAAKSNYRAIIHQIHETLYKYTHDKLNFFLSKPEIASLYCYFYTEGAGEDKNDSKFSKEFEFIYSKCCKTLDTHDANE